MQLMTAKVKTLSLNQILKHQKLLEKDFEKVDTNVVEDEWVITGEIKVNEVADESV